MNILHTTHLLKGFVYFLFISLSSCGSNVEDVTNNSGGTGGEIEISDNVITTTSMTVHATFHNVGINTLNGFGNAADIGAYEF